MQFMQKAAYLCRPTWWRNRRITTMTEGRSANTVKNLRFVTKILLIMKLTSFLLTAALVTVHASGISQLITLSGKDLQFKKVLSVIERQTDYVVFYNKELLENAKPITLSVTNMPVTDFLTEALKNQPLTFTIEGKTIMLSLKPSPGGVLPSNRKPKGLDDMLIIPPVTVKGKITDEEGNPLEGISVSVKGTGRGTNTNADGYFELAGVDENATLVISAVSIISREVKLNGRTMLTIRATAKVTGLDETQIIAYGKTSRRLQTGSVSTVRSETIERQPVGNVLNALKASVPGLEIRQQSGVPGAAVQFNIRGLNSLTGANDPFILVDGVPLGVLNFESAGTTLSLGGVVSGYSALNSINPNDIESIEVLKDADATAIYGSRGANGVILITTKKAKSGKSEIGVNIYHGVGEINSKLKMLSTRQYLDMRYAAFANDGVDWRASTVSAPDLKLWDTTRYTDWQETLIGNTARYTNAQLSLSGGNALTSFSVSGNYWRETLVYPGDFANDRVSGRFSLNHRTANDRLRFNMTTLYSNDFTDYPQFNVNAAYTLPPNAPAIYNADGTLNWEGGSWTNPFAPLYKVAEMNTHNLNVSGQIAYKLFKNLWIKTDLGYGRINNEHIALEPKTSFSPFGTNVRSRAGFRTNNAGSWNVEPYLDYELKLWKGKLSALLGTTFQERKNNASAINVSNFVNDALLRNPTAAQMINSVSGSDVLYRYNAVFGRINYNILNRYIINLTGRRDGSSRFGPGRQFGNFGAVGAAWIFSEEGFVKKALPFLSFGKLRGSYGITGSDATPDYAFLPLYEAQSLGRIAPTRLFNPDFQWESNTKFDAAIELGFKNSDILITANYYQNRSSNQLTGMPLPDIVGFPEVNGNLNATVQNHGWEFILNTINVKGKNFQWRTSANVSIPRNKLIAYPNLAQSPDQNRYVIGQSLTYAKVFDYIGVNPQTGLNLFRNRDGKDTSYMTATALGQQDRIVVLDRVVHYYGGLTNTLEYKGLSLDFTIQYSKRTRENNLESLTGYAGFANNVPLYVYENSWRKPGDAALFQKFTQATNTPAYRSRILFSSDAYYKDVHLFRLTNVSLSWRLPQSLQGKFKAQNARVYILAQNLLTFTNYKVLDPEGSVASLPPLKVITAGIQISF